MTVACLDFETYSPVDLKSAGLSRYVESPEFQVLICCYSIDRGPVQTWLPHMPAPRDLFACTKFYAHNAGFERAVWWWLYRNAGWPDCPPLHQWRCSMALGQSFGLPGDLEGMAAAIGAPVRKDPRGRALIRLFCMPDKKTGQRRFPAEHPEDWQAFLEYCASDVRAEQAVIDALPAKELPAAEQRAWEHQQRINERGIAVDRDLAFLLASKVHELKGILSAETKALTAGIEPTQRQAILEWMREAGEDLTDLKKTTVQRALKAMPEGTAKRVLELRASASKTSVAKYPVLLKRTSADGRLRHSMVYHGASTGRVTHKGFQPGNLPSREMNDAHTYADKPWLLGNLELLEMIGDPMRFYSALVRSTLIAGKGRVLVSGDYSQIEARMVAWMAGQRDLVKAFADKVDVYRYMAAKIYGRPVETIAKDSKERFVGKSATLGAGFGMGPARFYDYCRDNGSEISVLEAERAITEYRNSVPFIKRFWYDVKNAAVNAVRDPGNIYPVGPVAYACSTSMKWLYCKLPSGRKLAYLRPRVVFDEYGPQLVAAGVNTFTKQWSESLSLWHGTLVENMVQAAARDVMVEAALRLEAAGYPVVLTVHDEILCEPKAATASLDEMHRIMLEPVPWAPGLPLAVEGWIGQRYRK